MNHCGCKIKKKNEEKAKEKVGQLIGNLLVIEYLGMRGPKGKTRSFYKLKCMCGKKIIKDISNIGQSKSCGCLREINRPRGTRFSRCLTNETDVGALRTLEKSKVYTHEELAEMFCLTKKHILAILSGRTWKHVK